MRTFSALMVTICFYAVSSSALAVEWYSPANIAGQDSDWYNPLNWSSEEVPTSSDTTFWRYASSNGVYSPIIIDGGNAQSGTSICDIWYAGTASLTVTNGAVYDISGYLAVRNGAADAAHSPGNGEFYALNGSKVNVSGDSFIGRKIVAGTAFGACRLDIGGFDTVFEQGGYMWLGNGNNATVDTKVNVTDGAVLNINTTGGLRFQPDTINSIYPVVNVAGGYINIKGNRTGEIAVWLSSGYLIAYDGEGTIEYSYDETSGYTNISSTAADTVGYQNHVMISWGDQIIVCGPGTDAALDSRQSITTMMKRIKGRGFTGIAWRADIGDYEPGSIFINEWGYVRGLLVEASLAVSDSFDVLQYAQAAAENEGLEFWVWVTSVYSDGSPLDFPTANPGPFTIEHRYVREHPEVLTVDRSGNIYYGIREYAYPGARADKVDEITWFAEQGMKNIIACMRSEASQFQLPPDKADRYGFNQPVADAMLSLYGIDILTDPRFDVDDPAYSPIDPDVQKWHELRGSYLTQLYRDMKASVSSVNSDTRLGVMLPGGDYIGPVIGNIRTDWRTWIDEGLIDQFIIPQTLAATEDPDSPTKGYLTDNLAARDYRNYNPLTQTWGPMYTARDFRDYADSADRSGTMILQTGGNRYHREPAPDGADGWRTWLDQESCDLGWYQRWRQWKQDIIEFGHIRFFEQDFNGFPEYSSGRNEGWGEYRYVPQLRECPGLWWSLGDGTTNAPTAQSAIRRGSEGMAMRLKTGGDLNARHLTVTQRAYWSVDNPIMNGQCTFEFWVYRPDTTSSLEITLTQELNRDTSLGLWLLNSGAKYRKYVNGSYVWYGSSVLWQTGQWQKFKISVDLDNRTYSAFSGEDDSLIICTDAPYSGELSYFNMLKFAPEGTASSVCYLDDVSVKWMPELYFVPKGKNIYFADDFESHTIDDSIWQQMPDAGPAWQLSDGSQSQFYFIENDLSYADGWKSLAVPLSSEGNVLFVNDADKLTLSADNVITADLDIFVEEGKAAVFGITEGSGDDETAMVLIDDTGAVSCLDAQGYIATGKSVVNGMWYHFQLALDCASRTYQVAACQSGTMPFAVGTFNWNSSTVAGEQAVFCIKTQGGYSGTYPYVYYDNVEVTYGLPDECGNEIHPYQVSDHNRDCKVNTADLDMLAQSWLQNNEYIDSNNDGIIDIVDTVPIAIEWLDCSYNCD